MPFGRYHNARHEWRHILPGFWNCIPELVEPEVNRYELALNRTSWDLFISSRPLSTKSRSCLSLDRASGKFTYDFSQCVTVQHAKAMKL